MSGAREVAGRPVLVAAPEGPPLAGEGDAVDLLGEALSANAEMVAIPVARLSPEFLRPASRVAGEVLQKFANYRMPVAIVGDIAEALDRSGALRAFVAESNRGRLVWFVRDLAELEARLRPQVSSSEV